MANFVFIFDEVRKRRTDYLSKICPMMDGFSWLTEGGHDDETTALRWSVAPGTPVSSAIRTDGAFSYVLGEFETLPGCTPAESLTRTAPNKAVSGNNGYYFGLIKNANSEVFFGADALGLFPVYYYCTETLLIVASAPGLIRRHPAYSAAIDPHGMAGVLLTMHSTDGRTMLRGIRRLKPGHTLNWKHSKGGKEYHTGGLRGTSEYFAKPYEEHLRLVGDVFEKSVAKLQARASETSVLLSGGLDSRLLAGYWALTTKEGKALSLGDVTDYDSHCASEVARKLGWEHILHPVDLSQFENLAARVVDLEELCNGFNDLGFAESVATANATSGRLLTGFLGDAVLGGSHIPWAFNPETNEYEFSRMFEKINAWGFSPSTISVLARPGWLRSAATDVVDRLKQTWDSYEGVPFQRAWLFDLQHRQRLHVGSAAWRVSHGSWPLLPYADLSVLQAAAGLTAESMSKRRLQIDLLCERFEPLARLPLDRSSDSTAPLIQTKAGKLLERMKRHRLFPRSRAGIERRYYHRVLDLNNPGWVKVRQAAEPFRKMAEEFFDPKRLGQLLPPPNVPLQFSDNISEASSRKTLLGFMLWLGRNSI